LLQTLAEPEKPPQVSRLSVDAAQREKKMRHLARNLAGTIAAVTVAFSATAGVAADCPIDSYHCRPMEWRTSYSRGGLDVGEAVRLGVLNPEVLNAVLGKYPYRVYGYNNGTCIAYRLICDEEGRVIGKEPVVTC
jgi:hypothetical protein